MVEQPMAREGLLGKDEGQRLIENTGSPGAS